MIPTLHPLADIARRYRKTSYGLEAEMTSDEARQVQPDGQLWWEINNQASALYLTAQTEAALITVQRALRMKRALPVLLNMSVILESMGRFDEALPFAKEAYLADQIDNRARAHYAEALLRSGQMAEGWPLYRAERASMDWIKLFDLPEWEGPEQSLDGRRLLVIEGGGYGDNIYFLRWLDRLRRWGARIDYVCQPSFAPLVRRLGYHAIENWQGNCDIQWSDYDYYTPLLSIAGKLGVTLENYEWTGPYIKGKRSRWWRRGAGGPKVGFCWRAGESKSPRKQRCLDATQLRRICDSLPFPFRWVNLTHKCDPPTNVYMDRPAYNNWLDTANIVSDLDLLISVDTGVAHLGGAMGIPTWTLLPGGGAWQYPLGHDYHPLYPSMRIIRNQGEGLDSAVKSVIFSLQDLDLWLPQ